MTDILLDNSGDIDLSVRGSPRLARQLDLVKQRIAIRLKFWKAEWPFDVTRGFPYLQNVFVAGPNLQLIRSKLRDYIAATPGVKSVLEVTLEIDRMTRLSTCTWKAVSEFGPVDGSTAL